MKKVLLIALVFAMLSGLILAGCSTKSSGPPSSQATATAETLNVGLVAPFGISTDLDWIHGVEALVESDNKNGGLDIGGKRYKINLIKYDAGSDQNTEVAAINRLVFQDKVKYIIAFTSYQNAWISITDAQKVIVLSTASDMDLALRPNLHYSFNGVYNNPQFVVFAGWFSEWFSKNNPNVLKKVVRAFPDNQIGHFLAQAIGGSFQSFGVTPTDIYFPASQQDMSSVGTKVVSQGATSFMGTAGGTEADALIYNAAVQAGFKGQFFTTVQPSVNALKSVLSAQALEGFVSGANATEFDPPLTPTAKDFKDIWSAKYGKWESPDVSGTSSYYCLRTALKQAASVDTDKVADVLANGMKYETINGPTQMVSRPDLGNNRTVDSVSTVYIKKIHDGKPTLAATVSIEDALSYMRKAFPPLTPGATPPGGGDPSNSSSGGSSGP